jgi:hypothetical protein
MIREFRVLALLLVVTVMALCGGRGMAEESSGKHNQALWNGLSSGMSPEEVSSVLPGLHAPLSRQLTQDGWELLLQGRLRNADGYPAEIALTFSARKLMGVHLVFGGASHPDDVSPAAVRGLLDRLQRDNGEPARCKVEDDFKSCFWIRSGLFTGYMGRESTPPTAMLFFSLELPRDKDLLR